MTWEAHLERAERYLRSAKLLLADGDLASSISRSYYAMFHGAQAALLAEGIDAGTHRGVISTFGETFLLDGTLPREMGRVLANAFRERNLGEYEPTRAVPDDQAHELLEQARWFVEETRTFLSKTTEG